MNNMKEEKRVSSGIPGFDKLIEGGFEEHSINLIVGGSGSSKTIFSMQFIVEGLKKGESCLFITFEEKRGEFFKNMLEFGWDLEKYEKAGKFVFLEYSPEKVSSMLEEGGGAIESIVTKKNVKRMVLDSVSSFELLFEDESEKREKTLSLFDSIRNWGCTSLLTLEEMPEEVERGAAKSIAFEADSIILLHYKRSTKERKRFVEILKMRGTNHSTEIYTLEIKKSGAVIGTKAKDNELKK